VLNNLLTNALRYSPENARIVVSVLQQNNDIEFHVKDFGPGIDEKYTEKIFDRYFRVPGTKEKGTGLGLSISREFIEAQGGKIWVESAIGKGSTFSFSLPVS
jgi:NtrC-family two-component system sensor histidine kinase KinB